MLVKRKPFLIPVKKESAWEKGQRGGLCFRKGDRGDVAAVEEWGSGPGPQDANSL
jgi:hypothetical protein